MNDMSLARPGLAITLFCLLLCLAAAMAAEEVYTIGIIGTGRMGSALGMRLAEAGHDIVYGSRDASRDAVVALVEKTAGDARAASQAEAAHAADIIILAVPSAVVPSLIPTLGDLSGKLIIDITTGYRQGEDGYPEYTPRTSTGERIQALAPGARIVKTPFGGAETVRNPGRYGEPPAMFVAGDDREAKEIVARLGMQIGFFPLDAGPLRMGRSIDHMSLLYLVPLMQGRPHTFSLLPRIDLDLSCVSTEGWYAPVDDAGELAVFPNVAALERQCPDGPP